LAGVCAARLVGLLSLQFKARSDRLIVIIALLMLLQLHHPSGDFSALLYVWSFLATASINHRNPCIH